MLLKLEVNTSTVTEFTMKTIRLAMQIKPEEVRRVGRTHECLLLATTLVEKTMLYFARVVETFGKIQIQMLQTMNTSEQMSMFEESWC